MPKFQLFPGVPRNGKGVIQQGVQLLQSKRTIGRPSQLNRREEPQALDQVHALRVVFNQQPSTRVHIGIFAYLRQFKSCVPTLDLTITIGSIALPPKFAWSIPFRILMPLALGRPIRATSWIMLLGTRI